VEGEWQTVKSLVDSNILPYQVSKIIPLVCPYCHSDIIISSNLTRMCCSNEKCPMLVANTLELFFKELGIEQFGQANCLDIVYENDIYNIYEVLDLSWEQMPQRYTDDIKKKLYISIRNKLNQPIAKIVKALHLEGINDSAFKLFGDVNSIEDFYDELEEFGQDYIKEKLGINYGIRTASIYNVLMREKHQIINTVIRFNIIEVASKKIEIVITESVSNFSSKDAFIEYLNGKFGNKYNIIRKNSISKTTDYLIAERKTNTSKYQKALNYGIKIVTSEEFMKALESGAV